MKSISFIFGLMLLSCVGTTSRAQSIYISFGPKIGYAFGQDGGMTVGVEISAFPTEWNKHFADATDLKGLTFDATVGPRTNAMVHVGFEQVASWCIGADIGPSVLFISGKPYFGVSGIGFAGLLVYGFFELQYFPARELPTILTVGGYLKLPITHFPIDLSVG